MGGRSITTWKKTLEEKASRLYFPSREDRPHSFTSDVGRYGEDQEGDSSREKKGDICPL